MIKLIKRIKGKGYRSVLIPQVGTSGEQGMAVVVGGITLTSCEAGVFPTWSWGEHVSHVAVGTLWGEHARGRARPQTLRSS